MAITALHYITSLHSVLLHDVLKRLSYLPIIVASLLFGWRAALATSVLTTVLYVPHIVMTWHAWPVLQGDQYGEVLLFNVVGLVTGTLADRMRQERNRYREAARALEQANDELVARIEERLRMDRLVTVGRSARSGRARGPPRQPEPRAARPRRRSGADAGSHGRQRGRRAASTRAGERMARPAGARPKRPALRLDGVGRPRCSDLGGCAWRPRRCEGREPGVRPVPGMRHRSRPLPGGGPPAHREPGRHGSRDGSRRHAAVRHRAALGERGTPTGRGDMVCNNRGRHFQSLDINVITGDCNPVPVPRSIDGSDVVPRASELDAGAECVQVDDLHGDARRGPGRRRRPRQRHEGWGVPDGRPDSPAPGARRDRTRPAHPGTAAGRSLTQTGRSIMRLATDSSVLLSWRALSSDFGLRRGGRCLRTITSRGAGVAAFQEPFRNGCH